MKRHFSNWWPGYVMGTFLMAIVIFAGMGIAYDAKQEKRCLKAGYQYIDGTCFKKAIFAEWE
ncbi:hypothetical protein SEA_KENREY_241 [Streptomyces phage Kenrey]|nr:hypothetical protein SEA_KENREY_241 [Streptomyces phage Kenrey]